MLSHRFWIAIAQGAARGYVVEWSSHNIQMVYQAAVHPN